MRRTVCVFAVLAATFMGIHAAQVQHATERQDRRLWGSKKDWSFANLMYHLNACPEPVHCPGGPIVSAMHPCGCPDCSQPHPNDPAFAHGYCYAPPDGGAAASDGAADAVADEDSIEAASYNSTGNGKSTQNEMPPSANWLFNPLYYIIGAAVLSVGAAALIMRKRNVNHTDKFLEEANVGERNGMRGLGVMAAGAGLAAALGFRKKGSGASVGSDDLSGSVSRRIRSMEAGDTDSAPYYRQDEYDQPAFVNVIPSSTGGTLVMEHPESIEVQGPYRPSTYYASV